ncbi:unnamed protein product [Gongylonema pulchrum]|uniref:Uncharacterized protein n=1 Tax=Gongylonema pulchrum TaxID=637853 RepID=A0A3P7MGQ7_9BILA|nr:unnamed protein product [Gongylonema pulchrum]
MSRLSVSVDENRDVVAYPAGATVVLYCPRSSLQAHVIGASKNSITCLSFSNCGNYLATGEVLLCFALFFGCSKLNRRDFSPSIIGDFQAEILLAGTEPRVRIWQLYDSKGRFASTPVAEIKHHQIEIVCVIGRVFFNADEVGVVSEGMRLAYFKRFLPDGNVVSVGNQHDRAIVIWNPQTQHKIAESRLTSKVHSLDVTEQGGCVTVGVRHVKFWHIAKKPDGQRTVPLQGRSAILADQRNNTFLDVCCAPNNRTFSITETGILLEFHDKKLISTFDLGDELPLSMIHGGDELFIGFKNGLIRCFDFATLERKFTICKPHYLACDVAKGAGSDALSPESNQSGSRYPDVRALAYNKRANMLTAVYSDRSVYTWHPQGEQIQKISSQLFHVGPVMSLEISPQNCTWLPQGAFLTGGLDETIRIWNVDHQVPSIDESRQMSVPEGNIFSEELKKIIFIANNALQLAESSNEMLGASLSDAGAGVRSLRISPDGQHLAAGGRDGNLW